MQTQIDFNLEPLPIGSIFEVNYGDLHDVSEKILFKTIEPVSRQVFIFALRKATFQLLMEMDSSWLMYKPYITAQHISSYHRAILKEEIDTGKPLTPNAIPWLRFDQALLQQEIADLGKYINKHNFGFKICTPIWRHHIDLDIEKLPF